MTFRAITQVGLLVVGILMAVLIESAVGRICGVLLAVFAVATLFVLWRARRREDR